MKSPIPFKGFLSLQFSVAAVLPVITIAILVWFFVMPTIQTRTGIGHQVMARSISGQISACLAGGERQLTALAEYLQKERPDPGQAQVSLLDAQCGKGELFEALFIVDNDDMAIQTVGLAQGHRLKRDDFTGPDLSGRSFIHAARDLQKAVWSETFPSTVSSRMAVALSVPLADGFITGEIPLDNLSGVISHLPVESELISLIIDGRGVIIADSQNLRRGQMLNAALRPAKGTGSEAPFSPDAFELDGEGMLGTVVETDGPGWKVLVAQPIRKAFKPIRDIFLLMAMGLAIALVLLLSLSWLQMGNLSKRFQAYMAEELSKREKALVDSERQLKELAANIPGVVYQFSATRDHVYTNDFLNKKATEIFGLEPDPATFIDEFYGHIPDDEKERYLNSVREAVEQVEPWNYEGRFIRPDGETIWFSGTSVPRDEGESIVFYGVLTDITWRKEMESSLRLTQFCFDSAAVGIYHIRSDGQILNVNAWAARMLGYTIEELSGLSVWDIDPFATTEGLVAGWNRLAAAGVDIFETTHIRKDGSRIQVEITSNLLEYDGQQFSICFVRDITERKRMEESLRLTQFIFDKAPIGIWRMGEAGEVFDVNEQGCASLGYSREELCLMTVFDFAPGFGTEDWMNGTTKLHEVGTGTSEALHRRKNGEIFPIQVIENLMRFEGQEFRVAFVQDITERKRMEQALKESEERLDLALAGANEGIWDWRIDEDTLYLDSRYYTIAGYQPDEFPAVYDEILKRIHKDDFERVSSVNDRYLAGDLETFETEFRFLRKDGSYMWIQAKGRIVARDDQGNPLRFSGTHTDINDRKQAEETLKENERLLNNILESMNEGLFVLGSDFKCTIFNSSLGKMVDKTKAEAIGKPPWDSLPALKDTPAEENIRKTMTGEPTGSLEIRLSGSDREAVWFRDSFSPLRDDDGNVIGVVGVVSDITQRKQTENEREKLLKELQEALENVKTLKGLLPICSACKKIRDDKGYWNQIESYIRAHSEAEFTHGICPDCAKKLYPDLIIT